MTGHPWETPVILSTTEVPAVASDSPRGLTDYQRGYRAAQHRALSVAEANLARDEPDGIITAFKVALAMPIPPDPRTLGPSDE